MTKKNGATTTADAAEGKGDALDREEALHHAPLTEEELAFLCKLGNRVAFGETIRSDLAALLMDPDTIDALRRYRDFFRYGDVDVGPALEVLPHAAKLQQLQRRLDLASALVGRHIAATVKPVVGVVSDVRRMVVATPEGSSVRDAFATFDARWRETFPGGARTAPKTADEPKAAKADDAAPDAAPAAPTK